MSTLSQLCPFCNQPITEQDFSASNFIIGDGIGHKQCPTINTSKSDDKESKIKDLLLQLTFEAVEHKSNSWKRHGNNDIPIYSKTVNNLSIPTYRVQIPLTNDEVTVRGYHDYKSPEYTDNVYYKDRATFIDDNHRLTYTKEDSVIGALYGFRDAVSIETR